MFFLWYNTATAESELPPCQGEDHMQWTNCFGSYLKKECMLACEFISKGIPILCHTKHYSRAVREKTRPIA